MMKVVFRVDASYEIGSGHVMRCVTLANELKNRGAQINFICRDLPGNLIKHISELDYDTFILAGNSDSRSNVPLVTKHSEWLDVPWQQDAQETLGILKQITADWLIVDHYAIEAQWEQVQRPVAKRIMVIDDLADRVHDCDILLDQNLQEQSQRYFGMVPSKCVTLLGPKYALLREEFAIQRQDIHRTRTQVNRILVFFGGTDPTQETDKALDAIELLPEGLICDVVVGSNNLAKMQIKERINQLSSVNYYCQVTNMAELMAKADVAIGAGGSATWERCCLGLPTIMISVAYNQEKIAELAHKQGVGFYLGKSEQVTAEDISQCLVEMLNMPQRLAAMSCAGLELVDGKGVRYVAEFLF